MSEAPSPIPASAPPDLSLRLQPEVDLERRWLFIEASSRSAIAALIMLCCMGVYLAPYIGAREAWLWCGFMMFNFMLRLVVLRWALRQSHAIANEAWLTWFICGTALVMGLGSMYGSLHWFPLLGEPQQAMITLINVGWIAGGMAAQGCYPRWTAYWVVPVLLGNVLAWLIAGHADTWLVASLSVMATALMAWGQLASARSIKEALTAKLINKQLVSELTAQKSLVESAARAKSAFLIAASHDLRQPAMGVGLLVSAIQGTRDLDSAHAMARNAERALGAMERILQSLMEFSRLDSGQVSVRRSPFNLLNVVTHLVEEIHANLQTGVQTQVSVPPVMIVTDQSLFEQILRNLLSNAARFTPSGRIEVSALCGEDELTVTVSDTGIGIPEQALPDIFKEYFQANDERGRRAKGLGLGLSIVDKAARLLGARIEVQSKPGVGTSFRVHVPASILSAPIAAPAPKPALPTPPQQPTRLAGRSILIVDDDALVSQALQTVLETFGAQVLVADDPEAAVRLVSEHESSIRLAFVDYQISQACDGIQLITALRQRKPDLQCVLVTGDVGKPVSERARAASLQVLYKPLRVQQLIELVEA